MFPLIVLLLSKQDEEGRLNEPFCLSSSTLSSFTVTSCPSLCGNVRSIIPAVLFFPLSDDEGHLVDMHTGIRESW